MIRAFFAYLMWLLASLVIPVFVLVGILFATFFNPSYLERNFIPKSYDVAVMTLSEVLKKSDAQIGKTFDEEKIKSVLPKGRYENILNSGIRDIFSGMAQYSPKTGQEISLKGTKKALTEAIQEALFAIPVCDAQQSKAFFSGQQEGVPTCFPKELGSQQRDSIVAQITGELEANIPNRIRLPNHRYTPIFQSVSFALQNRFLITVGMFIAPWILFFLLGLLIYRPLGKLWGYFGKSSLFISFQLFLVALSLSQIPKFLLSQNAEVSETQQNIIQFLFSFPLRAFSVATFVFAGLGILAIFIGRFFRQTVAEESSSTAEALIIRKGKTRKGSHS